MNFSFSSPASAAPSSLRRRPPGPPAPLPRPACPPPFPVPSFCLLPSPPSPAVGEVGVTPASKECIFPSVDGFVSGYGSSQRRHPRPTAGRIPLTPVDTRVRPPLRCMLFYSICCTVVCVLLLPKRRRVQGWVGSDQSEHVTLCRPPKPREKKTKRNITEHIVVCDCWARAGGKKKP